MSDSKHQASEAARIQEILKPASRLDRRGFFVAVAATSVAATSGGAAAQQPNQVAAAEVLPNLPPPDTLHHSMRKSIGRSRKTFVKDLGQLVDLNPYNQGGAYWNFNTFITPIDQFYIRNEFGTPRPDLDKRVDRQHWTLKIHGNSVERELTITYNDLLKMPSRHIICTMECAGNGRSLFWEQQNMVSDPQKVGGTGWGLGGIGQAEWQYVPMSHILSLVGLKKTAKQMLFWSGVDNKGDVPGGIGDRGRPIDISMLRQHADVIGLAFKMNGKDLPADHGGPVRALVPGYCGAASTKWLTEIKIADHNFWVPLNSTAHVLIGPDYAPPKPVAGDEFRGGITAEKVLGQAVAWSPPKSLITVPLVLEKQPKYPHNYPLKPGELPKLAAGQQMMRGYAWAPQYGVRHVDYRVDGGAWQKARIEMPNLGRYTWVRFDFPWDAAAGRHVIETRVTDRKGVAQPETVPFNRGGFDYWGIPKFHVQVI
ncbi:MAG: molybdopterin-dependent oxidoreductase [Hyphomicrobiaceae bacterium]